MKKNRTSHLAGGAEQLLWRIVWWFLKRLNIIRYINVKSPMIYTLN